MSGIFADFLASAHIRCMHLTRRTDREAGMHEAFQRLGIENRPELFFSAVDGKNLSVTNPGLRPGNWGCALSKAAVMKEAALLNKPLVLLEDDIVIHPQVHGIMSACLAELPKDWKVLYLGYIALDPREGMQTYGQPNNNKQGKFYGVLAHPNLNHALIIRDIDCIKELSVRLADPETYLQNKKFASDYQVAWYFANKGIPMYGVIPMVAEQYGSFSDNQDKFIGRTFNFSMMPSNVLSRQWDIKGVTKFPVEWNVEEKLPEQFRYKGYTAVKVHPPFDVTLTLSTKSEIVISLLTTSHIKQHEFITVHLQGQDRHILTILPMDTANILTLDSGEYTIKCQPPNDMWRWKHVFVAVKDLSIEKQVQLC